MSGKNLLTMLVIALVIFSLTGCKSVQGKTDKTSKEPKNAEEAVEIYKELLNEEQGIFAENVELWEKVYMQAEKGMAMLEDGKNYGDFLLDTIDSISGEFTAAERTYIMFFIAAIGFNALSVCMYGGRFFTLTAQALTDFKFTLSVIGYLAVASSVAAFLLMNYATENIGAVRSASFSNIISVCSVFAGVVILKEDVSVWQLLCCAVIIIGVFGANKSKK